MVILHFTCIDNSKTSGVCVAVLQHVAAQGRFAETALINVNGIMLPDSSNQIPFITPFDIKKLPKPFDRPDLVVFHECYRPAYLAVALNLRKNNIPYVIVPHGELRTEAQRKKHLKKTVANLLLFNRFIDHAAALQCLSEDELKATRFGKRKFIGTNGVCIPDEKKLNFRSEGTVFIYIGRYEWHVKGLDLLFEAIKEKESFLRDNHCRFLLYGPDYMGRFAAVSAMVEEKEINDLVCLHHEILGENKKAALLDADIFLQTSRHEGMPIGILEAMSYALPCLVTEGTSLGSDIRSADAGWVAETAAPGIAECLEKSVRDRDRWREFGLNGRNAVCERYAWDLIAQKTISQYENLIAL